MSSDTLVRVENVSKRYCRDFKRSLWYGLADTASDMAGGLFAANGLRRDEFWAVDDVSFEVKRGECLGLIGRNGAGKTTLLKLLNGLIKPDRGRIEMRGRVGALIALGAGFNPVLTGRENIYVNGAILGLGKRDIDRRFEEIVDFAEISEFIDSPVQSYSSGMQVRLGFAVASTMDPDVLLLDEVLAVGDGNFRAKCYSRIGSLLERAAVMLVSHSMSDIRKVCDEVMLLARGRIKATGTPADVLPLYQEEPDVSPRVKQTILGDGVRSASLAVHGAPLTYGARLGINLDLELTGTVSCGLAYANIIDAAGKLHAQSMLDDLIGEYAAGSLRRHISIGPLFLPAGRYSINLVMLGRGGKETLADVRHAVVFDNAGPMNMGAVYYPPSTVTELEVRT